jgi:hypothetical protein
MLRFRKRAAFEPRSHSSASQVVNSNALAEEFSDTFGEKQDNFNSGRCAP